MRVNKMQYYKAGTLHFGVLFMSLKAGILGIHLKKRFFLSELFL